MVNVNVESLKKQFVNCKPDFSLKGLSRLAHLGTNVVDNFFSRIRGKVYFPNLLQFSNTHRRCTVKHFTSCCFNNPVPRQNKERKDKKYNNVPNGIFDINDLDEIFESNRRPQVTVEAEQMKLANDVVKRYRCSVKMLTIRQATCKGNPLSSNGKKSPLVACNQNDCRVLYRKIGALKNHMLRVHGLSGSEAIEAIKSCQSYKPEDLFCIKDKDVPKDFYIQHPERRIDGKNFIFFDVETSSLGKSAEMKEEDVGSGRLFVLHLGLKYPERHTSFMASP